MTEDQNPRVKVMRATDPKPEPTEGFSPEDEVFSVTLSNGQFVEFREMNASDLLYLEKTLGNVGDMERSLKLAARLSTPDGKITYEEMQKLKMKDLKKVTNLLAKAGGTDDEDEDPNL